MTSGTSRATMPRRHRRVARISPSRPRRVSSECRINSGGHHFIPVDQAKPGDPLDDGSPIHHVAIYIGGAMLIHAPATGQVVKVAPINFATIVGVSRPG